LEYYPTTQTIIFLIIFLIGYLLILLRFSIRNYIDLYDFLMLSSLALVPSIFVFFPKFVVRLARLIGVEFPFLLLFGFLFLIVFVYLYRLVIRITDQNNKIALLVQELGLPRQKVEGTKRSKDSSGKGNKPDAS